MSATRRVLRTLQKGAGIVLGDTSRENHEVIRTEDDFPDPEVRTINGSDTTVIPLKDGVEYEINGAVTHTYPILGNGEEIRGSNNGSDILIYTGSDTQLIYRNEPFFLSNILFMQTDVQNAQWLDISAGTSTEFLVRSIAIASGGSLGTVTGYRVPVFEFCSFDNIQDGLVFEGSPNKLFLIGCPIRNLADNGTAVELGSTLDVDFVDISKSFFKDFGNNTTGVEKHPSATVNEFGVFDGNLIDDSVDTQTQGFDQTTPGWAFTDNNGIPDSKSQAGLFMNDNTTDTTFGSVDTYVKVAGTTTEDFTERFNTPGDNRIEYTGEREVTLRVVTSVTATAGSGNTYEFAYVKNAGEGDEEVISNSEKPVNFGLFFNNNANITMNTYVTFSPGDTLEVHVKNLTNTDLVAVQSIQLTAGA